MASAGKEKSKADEYRPAKAGTRHLLVRNVPEALIEAVRAIGERDHRKLNAEVIVALEEWVAERRRRETSSPP
jgi:hypothetical protein